MLGHLSSWRIVSFQEAVLWCGVLCFRSCTQSLSIPTSFISLAVGRQRSWLHMQSAASTGACSKQGRSWRRAMHLGAILTLTAGFRVILSTVVALMEVFMGSSGSLQGSKPVFRRSRKPVNCKWWSSRISLSKATSSDWNPLWKGKNLNKFLPITSWWKVLQQCVYVCVHGGRVHGLPVAPQKGPFSVVCAFLWWKTHTTCRTRHMHADRLQHHSAKMASISLTCMTMNQVAASLGGAGGALCNCSDVRFTYVRHTHTCAAALGE